MVSHPLTQFRISSCHHLSHGVERSSRWDAEAARFTGPGQLPPQSDTPPIEIPAQGKPRRPGRGQTTRFDAPCTECRVAGGRGGVRWCLSWPVPTGTKRDGKRDGQNPLHDRAGLHLSRLYRFLEKYRYIESSSKRDTPHAPFLPIWGCIPKKAGQAGQAGQTQSQPALSRPGATGTSGTIGTESAERQRDGHSPAVGAHALEPDLAGLLCTRQAGQDGGPAVCPWGVGQDALQAEGRVGDQQAVIGHP